MFNLRVENWKWVHRLYQTYCHVIRWKSEDTRNQEATNGGGAEKVKATLHAGNGNCLWKWGNKLSKTGNEARFNLCCYGNVTTTWHILRNQPARKADRKLIQTRPVRREGTKQQLFGDVARKNEISVLQVPVMETKSSLITEALTGLTLGLRIQGRIERSWKV